MPPLILQTVLVRQNQQGTQYRLPGRSSLPRSCELSSHQTPIRTWNLPFSICPFPKKKKKRKFIRRKKKKKMGKKRAHGPTCIASGSSPNAPTLFVTTQIPGSEVDLSNSKFLSGCGSDPGQRTAKPGRTETNGEKKANKKRKERKGEQTNKQESVKNDPNTRYIVSQHIQQ
eukprot:TRINITY_DN133_c0_g1_i3.p1 TRINITY_DN133_c0_g1~~TRINITY_DN133_c0_g1_i3.p1  ORF type:complete len:172 (+),score=9.32 TRINITY_DN133_c0_g1_i3:277-792(+)